MHTSTQVKEAAEYINNYVEENLIKLTNVIKDNPCDIKTEVAADLLGVGIESMRTYLKNGGDLGVAWKKKGKQNSGMCVPTFQFLCKSYGIGMINIVKKTLSWLCIAMNIGYSSEHTPKRKHDTFLNKI